MGGHVFHEECSNFHPYAWHDNTSKCTRSPRIPSCDRLSEYIFGRLYGKQVPHDTHLPVAFQPWTASEASDFPRDLCPAMTPKIVQLATKRPMRPVCPMSHQRNVDCQSHTVASVNPMVSILLQEHWPVWICKSSFCGVTLHHLHESQVERLSSGRCPGLWDGVSWSANFGSNCCTCISYEIMPLKVPQLHASEISCRQESGRLRTGCCRTKSWSRFRFQ